MIGAGQVGALDSGRRRVPAAPAGAPDFTLSNATVATAWGRVVVGDLVPVNVDPATVYFVLAPGAPGGFAVENG